MTPLPAMWGAASGTKVAGVWTSGTGVHTPGILPYFRAIEARSFPGSGALQQPWLQPQMLQQLQGWAGPAGAPVMCVVAAPRSPPLLLVDCIMTAPAPAVMTHAGDVADATCGVSAIGIPDDVTCEATALGSVLLQAPTAQQPAYFAIQDVACAEAAASQAMAAALERAQLTPTAHQQLHLPGEGHISPHMSHGGVMVQQYVVLQPSSVPPTSIVFTRPGCPGQ